MSVVKTAIPISAPSALITAPIEVAASGNNTIIAAPSAGLRIRIKHLNFLTRGVVNARLLSAATNLSGLYNFGAAGGNLVYDAPEGFAMDLGVAEAFIINLSAAVGIDGFVQYFVDRG